MTPFSLRRTAAAGLLAIATVGATLGIASAQQAPLSPADGAPSVGVDHGGGGRFAQTPSSPPNGPGRPGGPGERPQLTDEQRQQMEQHRAEMEQKYVDALAKNLNLDSSTVKAALEQTRKDMQAARVNEIKQAVTDGKLTQEQADQIIQRMQQGGPGGPGMGFGGPGMGPGGPGMGPGGPDGPRGGGRGGPGGPNTSGSGQ
jgi:anti-sigma28 factor (negative regulator of flagellin synthesis)